MLLFACVMLGYAGATRIHRARDMAQRCDAKHGYGGWYTDCLSEWLMLGCACQAAP